MLGGTQQSALGAGGAGGVYLGHPALHGLRVHHSIRHQVCYTLSASDGHHHRLLLPALSTQQLKLARVSMYTVEEQRLSLRRLTNTPTVSTSALSVL